MDPKIGRTEGRQTCNALTDGCFHDADRKKDGGSENLHSFNLEALVPDPAQEFEADEDLICCRRGRR
jgi:hypothetical protein